MLNSKKLISLSLASALILSLPLNSLAIGVNDASNYVTSSTYNTEIAELKRRIADLEANQNTTNVAAALQTYFNEDSTSPILAGDYITITSENGKKVISATSKPTVIAAGNNELTIDKTETDDAITYTITPKVTSTALTPVSLSVHPDLDAKNWTTMTGYNSFVVPYGDVKLLFLSCKVTGSGLKNIDRINCLKLPSPLQSKASHAIAAVAVSSTTYYNVTAFIGTDTISITGLNPSLSYTQFYFDGCFQIK